MVAYSGNGLCPGRAGGKIFTAHPHTMEMRDKGDLEQNETAMREL